LIYFEDLAFTVFIDSEIETVGFKPKKQCTWSSTPFTIMVLQPVSSIKFPITAKRLSSSINGEGLLYILL
jgi:hypothetical protein